jgi:SAM-dependent methyltransferase
VGIGRESGLRAQILELAPWHIAVDVTPQLNTRIALEATERHGLKVLDLSPRFTRKMRLLYPGGLEGRSFLDCACNCGAYAFWAKELGAGECLGFDVREHWIKQAQFLLEHRTAGPTDGVHFELCDLRDVASLGAGPFDVTHFNGIFYHLADPVHGLKIVADMTRELLIVNTSARVDVPDGYLAMYDEDPSLPMAGVDEFGWFPTGPRVLERILSWAGFAEFRLLFWRAGSQSGGSRLELAASKRPGLLEHVPDAPREPLPLGVPIESGL